MTPLPRGMGRAVIRNPILFIAENGIMRLIFGDFGLFPPSQRKTKPIRKVVSICPMFWRRRNKKGPKINYSSHQQTINHVSCSQLLSNDCLVTI